MSEPRRACFALAALSLLPGCMDTAGPVFTSPAPATGLAVRAFEVDGCEYLCVADPGVSGQSVVHKGNCRRCAAEKGAPKR